MSEYLGIRLAMLDALQQYYKTPGVDSMTPQAKQNLLKTDVKAACERNDLLGERKEVIGEAWSKLISSRDPKAVDNFVNDPQIKTMATSLTETNKDGTVIEIKDKVKDLGNFGALKYVAANGKTLMPMATSFEKIAQNTGMINYKGLDEKGQPTKPKETLSDLIDGFANEASKARAAEGKATPERKPENHSFSQMIKGVFDNSFSGKVDQKYLDQQSGDHAKTQAHATPAPVTPSPGAAIHHGTAPPTPAPQVTR